MLMMEERDEERKRSPMRNRRRRKRSPMLHPPLSMLPELTRSVDKLRAPDPKATTQRRRLRGMKKDTDCESEQVGCILGIHIHMPSLTGDNRREERLR